MAEILSGSPTVLNDAPRPSLRARALRASGWTFGGFALGQVFRLGSNLIMTRLLVPEMFGVMLIATMVMVILGLLSDIGLRQSVVQSPRGGDAAFLDTAWVIQIIRGFGLWLFAVLVSLALIAVNHAGLVTPGTTYTAPVLPWVIVATSFTAVISGFQSMKYTTAVRNLDQKPLVQIELIGQLTSLAAMIALGLATRSVWALVGGALVGAVVATVLSHVMLEGHRDRFRWDKSAAAELVRYGRWVLVSSSVGVLAINGDRLILGGLISADELGLYGIALLIVGSVEGALHKLLISVSLPAFSEVVRREPARLNEVYYRIRLPADAALLFFAGFLFVAGDAVIAVLYDQRYAAAGGMVEILAVSLIAARFGTAHQAFLAIGEPRYLATVNAVRFVALYLLLPTAFHFWGLPGAIWAVALHTGVTIPFVYFFSARHGLLAWQKEAAVLGVLLIGGACGLALEALFAWIVR